MINILDNTDKIPKKNQVESVNLNNQKIEQISQIGKTPEEMAQYLLSGESDDLSFDFIDKL